MSAAVLERESDEAGPSVGVGMRSSFAREIGQEEQSFRSGRDRSRFLVEDFVGTWFSFSQCDFFAERLSKPLQRAAAAQAHAHHVPLAVDSVAEGMQPA